MQGARKGLLRNIAGMDDRELDEALETAADRAQEAQRQFATTPAQSPELPDQALTVEHRAEDLHELAVDATAEAAEEGSSQGS